jgi:hypothetical protein
MHKFKIGSPLESYCLISHEPFVGLCLYTNLERLTRILNISAHVHLSTKWSRFKKLLSMLSPRTCIMRLIVLCWVPHLLKKRNHIIDSAEKTYHKMTHKFGIEVPRSWDEYVILDMDNGKTTCQDTVTKEMKNFCVTFKILIGDKAIPPTYQEIHCNMLFYVNMEDFQRNVRFVAGGRTTDTPHPMTYASVVP